MKHYRKCCRIAESLGMSLGDGESDGLAFTVCGGKLVDGSDAPKWLARLNGCSVEEIAEQAAINSPQQPINRTKRR